MAPTRPAPIITLDSLSFDLRISLDKVRERFRTDPRLIAVTRRAGRTKFVTPDDVPLVRELLLAAG